MTDDIARHAVISEDGKYRYTLTRVWGDGPLLAWCMLNPSTADGRHDDPTIRRCIMFSQREGCGSMIVVNLFALRSTSPRALLTAIDPYGPANERVIWNTLNTLKPKALVCAWGVLKIVTAGVPSPRAYAADAGVSTWCLGKNKDGSPKHPLYVPSAQPFEVY